MKLFNRQKRIQYLGFNDVWFSIIGILILGTTTNYLFNNPDGNHPWIGIVIGWSASFIFTVCDWLINRAVLIYLRKKYPDFKDDIKRITLLLFTIIIVILSVDFIMGNLIQKILGLFGFYSSHSINLRIIIPVMIITMMIMAIYEAVYHYVRLKTSIREEEQTKQVMIQAQLDTLRNQAKPHFLFNSFNTLRDIIDEESKEDAKEFVDKLSDVYRFILESGNENLTSLQKELKFVKSYVHIQKERFGDNLHVHWNIPESRLLWQIVPMSLQLLIENAIKHNVVSKAKPLIVKVGVEEEMLIVSNKIQAKSTSISSTKIGLKNIEKRYALISNNSVDIHNDGVEFRVSIPLLKSAK